MLCKSGFSLQDAERKLAESTESTSAGASEIALLRSEVAEAQKVNASLSKSLMEEKARLIQLESSRAETQRSLQARVEHLSSQLESTKVSK
jgi:uncharacterized protein involved in exopolysaccharide biosynthesis